MTAVHAAFRPFSADGLWQWCHCPQQTNMMVYCLFSSHVSDHVIDIGVCPLTWSMLSGVLPAADQLRRQQGQGIH